MKKRYLVSAVLAATVAMVGCNSGSTSGSGTGSNSLKAPTPTLSITVQPYTNTQYYTTSSNTPYYIAMTIKNPSALQQNLSLVLSNTNAFSIVPATASAYYPSGANICGATLAGLATCEVIVKLNNPVVSTQQTGTITATLGSQLAKRNLTQNPVAYIAGGFSQTYGSNPIAPITGINTSCGLANNSYCQLIKYDITTGNITTAAIANSSINTIAVAPSGLLTFAGQFTAAGSSVATLLAPTLPAGNPMVANLNPASTNGVTDAFAGNDNNTPNSTVNSIAYDSTGNMFITGGFTQVGNISVTGGSNTLVAKLSTAGTWSNALGNNGNPNGYFTSSLWGGTMGNVQGMALDSNNNLYLTGAFTQIGSTSLLNSNSGVVQCSQTGGVYNCTPATNNVSSINDFGFALATDASGNLYSAGSFSSLGNLTAINPVIGYTSTASWTPTASAVWSAESASVPNASIATVAAVSPSKIFTGGLFSSIGSANAPAGGGTCGSGAESGAATNACLFASYNNGTWLTVFGTDNWINTSVLSSYINAQ